MARKKPEDICEVFCSDREKVERMRSLVGITEGMARVFKALADETRLKIVYALSMEELCVCDVAGIINSSVATASHHLRYLGNTGLARYRREGKMVFYSLRDDCVREIVNSALKHGQHDGRGIDERQTKDTGSK